MDHQAHPRIPAREDAAGMCTSAVSRESESVLSDIPIDRRPCPIGHREYAALTYFLVLRKAHIFTMTCSDERHPYDQIVRMGAPYRQAVERETRGGARVHPQEPNAGNDEQSVQVSNGLVVRRRAVGSVF